MFATEIREFFLSFSLFFFAFSKRTKWSQFDVRRSTSPSRNLSAPYLSRSHFVFLCCCCRCCWFFRVIVFRFFFVLIKVLPCCRIQYNRIIIIVHIFIHLFLFLFFFTRFLIINSSQLLSFFNRQI